LLYQAGGRLAYEHEYAEFWPQSLPEGVLAAGRVVGNFELALQCVDGRLAGLQAATFSGFGEGASEDEVAAVRQQIQQQPRRTSDLVKVPGQKKQFLCYCEDVTDKDVATAIAEGYDSLELLKRYSTIGMGPCQGKMCSLNGIHLCARANNWTVEQTGMTTARPPMTPVEMGVLAGQHMEPVQITAVHEWHIAHGARMMVAGEWLRPEHYGEATAEVQAVRERVGLIDVSTLGKLRFTGPGVPDLLDRIYVNKWQQLGLGRVRYGLMCNGEGVILDDGVTARVGPQEWYTTTTSSGAGAMYEWIQWWLQSGWGEGVHLANVTEDFAAFNLAGPQSRALLQQLIEADLSNEAIPYMQTREVKVAGVPCRLLRIGFTGELSYELHCPAGYGLFLWEAIMAAGQDFGILPFGVEAQRVLRLEKGHIIVGQDTDALTDPIAADMAWIVKLDKADFLGQRAIGRVSETGARQRLVGFKLAEAGIVPEEGLQIVQANRDTPRGWEIIGWVSSSRFSPTLKEAIGLCWLPAELAAQAGAQFTIWREGKLVTGIVHHGAFYDPEGRRLRG
jgi:sarcosine oxidase subunit alpha